MIINITIPKNWNPQTKTDFKRAVEKMAIELKKSIIANPEKYGAK